MFPIELNHGLYGVEFAGKKIQSPLALEIYPLMA